MTAPLDAPTPDPDALPPDPPAVARYRRALGVPSRVFEYPLTPLDATGVPVWMISTWPGGEFQGGVGYGETFARARVGAWGEMAEGVAVHRLRGWPARRASAPELRAEGAPHVDPRAHRLPVGTGYRDGDARLWVEARRFAPGTGRDGEAVWTVLDAAIAHKVNVPDGYRPLFTPITNGLGAGDTLARAAGHGMLELVQRDASSVGYRAFDRGVVLDLGPGAARVRDAGTRALVRHLQEGAGITLQVKLAETPLGIPVVYVVGRERDLGRLPHPLVLTGCGEGAHPNRERALHKALLEFAASRVRKRFAHGPIADVAPFMPAGYVEAVRRFGIEPEETRALDAVAEWAGLSAEAQLRRLDGTWFREAERVPFDAVPTVDAATAEALEDPAALAAHVAARYADAGIDVLYVPLTEPGAEATVVRVIAPGMEVETVTYGRIGPRNLRRLLERARAGDPLVHPDLAGLGRPPAHGTAVPLAPEAEAALGGPAWIDLDLLEEAAGPHYAMYREPAGHVVDLTRAAREARAGAAPAA